MNFTKLPLGDVVELIRTGSTPSTSHPEFFNGSIPWFTPGDIGETRGLIKSTRYITEEGLKAGKAKLFEKEMLLVTCIGDIGRVGVLQQPSSSNQQITALKFKGSIDVYFAYYWFIAHRNKLEQLANQAVVPILNNERLGEVEFFYPPLSEQRRIAALLARAGHLRRLQRYADSLSASLLQSVFLEMFGDIETNHKGWDKLSLEEIVQPNKIITYGIVQAGPHIEHGIPYIRTGDIKDGEIVLNGLLRTSQEIAAKYKRSEVKAGDLVISIRATVGTIAEVPLELDGANLTQGTARISPSVKVNKKFLLWAIRSESCQKIIEQKTKGATFREITLEALREIPMIIPPLPEQERFAKVVQRVESLRQRQAESARQGEALFQSLLSQGFGEGV
jgi:type I restriction enzyme, S subunit